MSKNLYGILVLLLNGWGITYFLNSNIKKGILTIVSGIITCDVVYIINFVKGIIMGIKILKMSEEEFAAADKATFDDTITFFCKD